MQTWVVCLSQFMFELPTWPGYGVQHLGLALLDCGYTSRLEHSYNSKMAALGKNVMWEANAKLRKCFCSRQRAYFLLPVLPIKVLMERENLSEERELLT